MPEIPKSTPQISQNVPGVNAPYSREFANLGNSIAGAGGDLLSGGINALETMKKAEAQNFADNAYNQEKIDSADHLAQLKLEAPDGYIHDDPKNPTQDNITQNSDGTPRTMTQEYRDQANERFQDAQQKMPSELAAQLYRERTMPYITDQIVKTHGEVQVLKTKTFDFTQNMWVQKIGDQVTQNPGTFIQKYDENGMPSGGYHDISDFYNQTNDQRKTRAAQVGNMYDATGALERSLEDEKKLSYYEMKGAFTQALADKKTLNPNSADHLNAWLDVLHGDDPASKAQAAMGKQTISTMLDPVQKEKIEDALLKLIPSARMKDSSDFMGAFNNHIDKIKSGISFDGRPSSLAEDPMLMELVARAKTDDGTGDFSRGKAIDKFAEAVAAYAEGDASGPAFKRMSPSAKNDYIESSYRSTLGLAQSIAKQLGFQWSDEEGGIAATKIREKLINIRSQDDAAQRTDQAAYLQSTAYNNQPVMDSGNKFAKTIPGQSMVALQTPQNQQTIQKWLRDSKTVGDIIAPDHPEYQRPIDKSLSEKWGGILSNPGISEQQTWDNFKGLSGGFGHAKGAVIEQMVKDEKLNPIFLMLHDVDPNKISQTTGVQIVSALRGAGAIDDQFKKNVAGGTSGVTPAGMESAVTQLTQKWAMARDAANPYSTSNHQYQDYAVKGVLALAQSYYNADTSLSANDAAQRAYNTFIGQFTSPTKNGAPGRLWGNTGAGYSNEPNEINGKPLSDVEKSNRDTNMTRMLSPDSLRSLNLDRPTVNGRPDLQGEHWEDSVSRTAFRSFTSNPAPGYHLMYQFTNERGVSVTTPLKKDGKPFFVPWEDAIRGTGAANPPPVQKFIPNAIDNLKKSAPATFSRGDVRNKL